MKRRLHLYALLLLVTIIVLARKSTAASTVITTNPDGSINCDGLNCPRGDGVRCSVTGDTVNGLSTVNRQCINAEGAVILSSSYNVNSPGLAFARQASMAILFTQK